MPSVFESFGIKKNPDFTAVPQLGVSNYINSLQLESHKYFTIPTDAQAADNQVLAIKVVSGQNFRTTNQDHIEFINKCTALVKEKSMALKMTDLKMMASLVVGVAATALSFLPFVSILGWIGWGSTLYFIHQRAIAYAEYQESLTLLVGACNWSLGEGLDQRKDKATNLTKNEAIRNMMAELYPVLTESQIKHLIADDIEGVFTKELEAYEEKFQLGFNPNRLFATTQDERIALSKKGAEFKRCIYGFNKGNFSDFLDAIASFLPDLYRAAHHGVQRLSFWWQEKNHATENHEVELNEVASMQH